MYDFACDVARVRVLRTCVMQPSVRLRSAFPHAACAAKEHSFLAYPAIDAPYCSLQPDDAPSVTLCVCAALTTTASIGKPSKPSLTHGGASPPNWSSERWYARNPAGKQFTSSSTSLSCSVSIPTRVVGQRRWQGKGEALNLIRKALQGKAVDLSCLSEEKLCA